jgi:peptide/nickel transport system ATP-binding protein
MNSILEIQDLKVYFRTIFGDAKSLDGVSLKVYEGEILGIAGESGCGKSTLVEGVLKLVKPPGYIHSGRVIYNEKNLLELEEEEFRKLRWKEISYIPQGSMNSLNPVIKIEEQMVDGIISHIDMPYQEAKEIALEALNSAGLLPDVAQMFPHELSGGMRQRVCIAMSICLKPKIVFADEPVTALDVVMQKLNLQTIGELKEKFGITVVMVAHDMAWHAEVADRICIMYAGKIVETGSTTDIFSEPLHPYTKGLLAAIPSLERKFSKSIPGIAPSPLNWPNGCRFHPRCSNKMEVCEEIDPSLIEIGDNHFVACHLYGGE